MNFCPGLGRLIPFYDFKPLYLNEKEEDVEGE